LGQLPEHLVGLAGADRLAFKVFRKADVGLTLLRRGGQINVTGRCAKEIVGKGQQPLTSNQCVGHGQKKRRPCGARQRLAVAAQGTEDLGLG
jgi:hypothetical protein